MPGEEPDPSCFYEEFCFAFFPPSDSDPDLDPSDVCFFPLTLFFWAYGFLLSLLYSDSEVYSFFWGGSLSGSSSVVPFPRSFLPLG